MNDATYLRSLPRQTSEEREAFAAKYGLSSLEHSKPFTPEELYAAHSGHEESHYGGSH